MVMGKRNCDVCTGKWQPGFHPTHNLCKTHRTTPDAPWIPKYAPSVPMNLAHKPWYAFRYAMIDGKYAERGKTDCEYLSLGAAQWDRADISLKTWRWTGEKWSRQSEELPVHRAIDLVTFFAQCLFRRDGLSKSVCITADHFLTEPKPRRQNEVWLNLLGHKSSLYGSEADELGAWLEQNPREHKRFLKQFDDLYQAIWGWVTRDEQRRRSQFYARTWGDCLDMFRAHRAAGTLDEFDAELEGMRDETRKRAEQDKEKTTIEEMYDSTPDVYPVYNVKK